MSDKVVLAYSGGLDTSVAIRWLKQNYNLDVIALAIDVGNERDFSTIQQKALRVGAVKALVKDAKELFVNYFIFPALQADAVYEGQYPLATALSRPLMAKLLVDTAVEEEASAVAHGCTGKGNDQVRFEVSINALAPELKIIAPAREWDMTREQTIDYAQRYGIPVASTTASPYSIDENLWGRSIECGVLEDPWAEPPEDVFTWTRSPNEAPDKPSYVEIGFEKGIPTILDIIVPGKTHRKSKYDLRNQPIGTVDVNQTLMDKSGNVQLWKSDKGKWGVVEVVNNRYVVIMQCRHTEDKARAVFKKTIAQQAVSLIRQLNTLAGEHGVGRIDHLENRLVGIKSREIYESPAAVVLLQAHQALEAMTLSKEQLRLKQKVAQEYADLIYNGLWFTSLHQDLAAYVKSSQRFVTGTVRLKLFKGSCQVVGRKSPYSLYSYGLATYDKGDIFDQSASSGFIHIWGLPVRTQAQVQLIGEAEGPLGIMTPKITKEGSK